MSQRQIQEQLTRIAADLEVHGAAVGVHTGGEQRYAVHGVTNAEHPLAVDADTMFPINSTGKTFTGTAMMCLVDRGAVDLHAPVRRYVPELRLQDDDVAREVTVLQLLNHTAGWDGDLLIDTGDGDEALANYVERMAELEQICPLGAPVTYNNAALSLAGRVIEKVTATSYEEAVKDLLLRPLKLTRATYFPWARRRCLRPMGVGLALSVRDQIAWARFHLGDGTGPDGTRVLSEPRLRSMREPTVEWPDSPYGHAAVGITWMIRDAGVRVVFHDGNGDGHHSGLLLVPERDFALAVATNGRDGAQVRDELQRWALERYLDVAIPQPELRLLDDPPSADYVGYYEIHDAVFEITADGGELVLDVRRKPGDDVEEPFPTLRLGLLPGGGDRYVVTHNPHKGVRGRFVRDETGTVEAIHFGGRLARRTEVRA